VLKRIAFRFQKIAEVKARFNAQNLEFSPFHAQKVKTKRKQRETRKNGVHFFEREWVTIAVPDCRK
jgi:hypothetical protein